MSASCPVGPASLGAEQGMRTIEVDWEGEHTSSVYRVGVEVVALDRSRLLPDVANALVDHRVNIVSSGSGTGSDRIAKMRSSSSSPIPDSFPQ